MPIWVRNGTWPASTSRFESSVIVWSCPLALARVTMPCAAVAGLSGMPSSERNASRLRSGIWLAR